MPKHRSDQTSSTKNVFDIIDPETLQNAFTSTGYLLIHNSLNHVTTWCLPIRKKMHVKLCSY